MFISSPCRHQSTRDILSDKSHVSYMKGRGLDLSEYDEYDDEYDDTYDSQNVGATDQDSADELLAVKRLVCYIHFIIVHIALIIFTCMHTVQTCSYFIHCKDEFISQASMHPIPRLLLCNG